MASPFNPNEPIPNDPFNYERTAAISGPLGPIEVGSGLEITPGGEMIAVGGGPAVTYLTAGAGIFVNANTGSVRVTNTGVLNLAAGTGIGLARDTNNGTWTITNTAPAVNVGGTVTQVNTGDGLVGGPITTSGTIALSNTGVGAGTYQNATVTVDAKGRITAASPGTAISTISGTAPIVVTPGSNATVSINEGSPLIPGALRICDSVSLSCSSVAASSTAVKNVYDLASAALPCSLLTSQGDLISSTGSGAPLRVPAGADGSFLKVCTACSGTGGLTWDSLAFCEGTVTSITAGNGLTGGTITASGTIALDTSCVLSPTLFTSQGTLLTATGPNAPTALGAGSNGQLLSANNLCSEGLEWVTPTPSVPCSAFNVKGDLLFGTGVATYAALPVGANGTILSSCSACVTGVTWVSPEPVIPATCITGKGALITGSVPGIPSTLPVGANGYVLSANSACSLGLEWVQNTEGDVTSVQATFPLTVDNTNPQVPVLGVGSASLLSPGVVQLSNTVTSTSTSQAATANAVKDAYDRGTLANTSAAAAQATANAAQSDATQALLDAATAQGTADQAVLDAAAAQSDATQALSDAAAAQTDADQALLDAAAAQSTADAAIPCAAITGKGAILTGSAASTPSALAVGTNGKVLAANSACASGLEWITPASTPQASQTSLGTLYGLAGSAFGDNVASGWGALGNLNTGLSNTAFGQCALYTNGFDSNNTAIGAKALAQSNGANGNTAIGNQAGFNLTTGDQNTIIGNSVDAPVATGNCQLAIGFPGGCWLTGCSNKNIKPGAGILDCAGSAGTAGQVLMSNGANAICWGTASGGSGIPCSTITAKGALVTGTAANTPSGLTVGTNGQVLTACSACTTGLTWVTPAAGCLGTVTSITAGTGLTGGAITTSGTISLDTACVIQPTILTAKGSLISASAASTPTALSVGTDGQILYACSTAANGLCWAAAPGGSSPATPTVAGVLEGYSCGVDENISVGFGSMPLVDPASGGCRNTSLGVCALSNLTFGSGNVAIGSQTLFCATNSGNSIAIGNCALRSSTFSGNVAIGNRAACTVTTGDNNVAIGSGAMQNATTPSLSIAIGCRAMQFGSGSGNMGFGLQALCKVSGNNNIGLGYASGSNLTTGSNNTFLGSLTGGFTTTGCCNIFIGFGAGPLSNVDCCLWIGLDSATPWLTGNNTSALKPGAGIIDCAGSCGTAGQVLMSTGSNALCWGTVSSGSGTVTSVCAGTGLCGGDITTSGTISLDTACIIQPSAFTAKGNILSATAANTPTALPVGTDGQVLSACSACSTGLVWATPQTSPFITYTTSAISYTNGTPVLVAVWNGGFLQGTITLDLVGYGGVTPFWDIFLSGDATNYNTGWYQTAFWPPTTDGLSQGTWYVDFPVYPSANNGKWEFYFNPTQDSLNPSSFTFFFRTNSVPTWQI